MVELQIRKYHNQFKNGALLDQNSSVFTHYLLGFVGQKMKRVTKIATSWKSESSDTNIFSVVSGGNTIIRQSGSWINDGFQIGDTIDWQPFGDIETITNLTDLVLTISGTFSTTSQSNAGTLYGTSRLRGINYYSNFIENDDPTGYISKIDLISSRKWTVDFTVTEFDNLTLVTATPSGTIESWKMGSDLVTMQMIQLPILSNGYTQILQVVEIFTITPFFDNIINLEAGIKPDYLASAKSLRGIAKFELLHTTLNPIVKHVLDDSDTPDTYGNVGYYDEHFNGFTPVEFTKFSLAYSNPSNESKIVVDETTAITAEISSVGSLFSQGNTQFQMNLIFLNEDIDNTKNIDTNFAFDTVFAVADGSSKSGENGIFTNVIGNIASNRLVVTADIIFTPTQQSLIENGKYILSIATNDHLLAIDQSKLVNVKMDINTFVKNNDIPDLMAIVSQKYYEHPFDKGTQGKTDYKGWVEDGMLMSSDFTLDLSKGAVINSMNVRLMARKSTGEDFEIANVPFDFTGVVVSGGVQQLDVNNTRGFKLVDNSQFNFVKIKKMAKVGDIQHYDLDVAFKMQWMDWISLPDADSVFFDNTKLNNGLNRLISNYSDLNDYNIVIYVDAEVSNGVLNTNYNFISPAIRIYEHGTDNTGNPSTIWGAITETFDQSNNNLQEGIHGTENTEVKVTFTALSGIISGVPLYVNFHLEEYQKGSLLGIWELSSFRDSIPNNPLIPKVGESKTKFTTSASTVIGECAIDFTRLNPASQYKISARLGASCNQNTGCAWGSQSSGITALLQSVSFPDINNGWICNNIGGIIKTSDAGQTWTPQTSGVSSDLRSIFFIDSNNGWACGQLTGHIIKTIDGGSNWTISFGPTTVFVFLDIFFIDTNNGWTCGIVSNSILKTVDGGTNWTTHPVGASVLFGIFFIDANIGWACGNNGVIRFTTNGGTSWSGQTSGTISGLRSVFFIDANIGWACGFDGVILTTIDGGGVWNAQNSDTTNPIESIFFIDANIGWACGGVGIILETTDGGTNWNLQTSGTIAALQDIIMLSATNGYTVGGNGTILKYTCETSGCNILQSGILKEDGVPILTESGNNLIQE